MTLSEGSGMGAGALEESLTRRSIALCASCSSVARAVVDSEAPPPRSQELPRQRRPGAAGLAVGDLRDAPVTLVAWVLLSTLVIFLDGALATTFNLDQSSPASLVVAFITVPHVAALALSTSFAGYLVGRYGGATAGLREAVLGGLFAGLLGVFATLTGSWKEKIIRTVVVLFIATLSAGLAARRAIRQRS